MSSLMAGSVLQRMSSIWRRGGLLSAAALCLLGLAAVPAAHGVELTTKTLLQGRIELVDPARQVVVIAGQRIFIKPDAIPSVSVGMFVAAVGTYYGTAYLVKLPYNYVPGSSGVLVTGAVLETRHDIARVRIGSQWIDYSGVLSIFPHFRPAKGDLISASGTQPALGGIMFAGCAFILGTTTRTDPIITKITIVRTTYSFMVEGEIYGSGGIIGGGFRPPGRPPPQSGFD